MSPADLSANIVILNYNGRELLPKCLPSIVTAARRASIPTQVTILDNLSQDDGLEYVRREFPDLRIENAPQNRILCSYNDFIPKLSEPIVILLNNDIRVDEYFVDPLIEQFREDPKTFLVAPKVMSFDGSRIEAGAAKAGMRWGIFWCDARFPGYESQVEQFSTTYSSGFGAFSREKFLRLGGYDDRYLPGIMEDVDLCYRAQKAGFTLYYQPKSVVYHLGQTSFKKKFGIWETSVIGHRNNFLFMWKNFSSPLFWLIHCFLLPFRLVFAILKGNGAFAAGFWRALQIKIR